MKGQLKWIQGGFKFLPPTEGIKTYWTFTKQIKSNWNNSIDDMVSNKAFGPTTTYIACHSLNTIIGIL